MKVPTTLDKIHVETPVYQPIQPNIPSSLEHPASPWPTYPFREDQIISMLER